MMHGVGSSTDNNPVRAVRDALAQALGTAQQPRIVFLFTAGDYDLRQALEIARQTVPTAKLVGGRAPGLIVRGRSETKGVAVAAISDPRIRITTYAVTGNDYCDRSLGEHAGEKICSRGFSSGTVFVFPSVGMPGDTATMLRALYGKIGPDFSFVGGTLHESLCTEQGVVRNGLALAVIEGAQFVSDIGHGWNPLPEPMIVTKCQSKVILEVDGQPAYDRYQEVIRENVRPGTGEILNSYPLGIPSMGGRFLMRDVVGVTENKGLILIADIPQRCVATVMTSTAKTLIRAAQDLARRHIRSHPRPEFVFFFDCVSRYTLLQTAFQTEVEAVWSEFGQDMGVLGLLTNGEISSTVGVPLLYNKSIALTVGGAK